MRLGSWLLFSAVNLLGTSQGLLYPLTVDGQQPKVSRCTAAASKHGINLKGFVYDCVIAVLMHSSGRERWKKLNRGNLFLMMEFGRQF